MASFIRRLVESRSKSPQKRVQEKHYNNHNNHREYIPPYAPPVCYLPLPPSPLPYHSTKNGGSSHSNESFGIHSWNTEPREVDDVNDQIVPTTYGPGPLMRARSHSPRKMKRDGVEERKSKAKSKSPQKVKQSQVFNQLDYLTAQCHLEGCRADIVVNSTRFMLCRHQLSHCSVFFKDLLSGQENSKDFHISVSSMSDPTPTTQFRWFVESAIPCPALKDISDETLETCMRLAKRFQAKGLELRCAKYLIENCCNRQPIVVLCWLNWCLKHNFDPQTQVALLPSVSRLSLNALERHRHMITDHIYSDIVTAKLRGTYEKTVHVFLDIHKLDHFTVDLDSCPRCKRSKEAMKVKVHCDPCRKQVGCDRCLQEGCEIAARNIDDMQAFFKCPHGMHPLNDATDDCQCQIGALARHLGQLTHLQPRGAEKNDDYMVPTDQMQRKSRRNQRRNEYAFVHLYSSTMFFVILSILLLSAVLGDARHHQHHHHQHQQNHDDPTSAQEIRDIIKNSQPRPERPEYFPMPELTPAEEKMCEPRLSYYLDTCDPNGNENCPPTLDKTTHELCESTTFYKAAIWSCCSTSTQVIVENSRDLLPIKRRVENQ